MRKRSSSFLTKAFFFIFFMLLFLLSSLVNRIDLICLVSFDYAQIRSKLSEAFEAGEDSSATEECPEHFRWIHEDLKPWKSTGITRDMVERGTHNNMSNFRLVISKGKAYIKKYKNCFATRDVFTLWGILQLLRLYPGRVPDLELLFECDDDTVVKKTKFQTIPPPPVFHYCGDNRSFDIVFPDWTFWGWAETNIRAWEIISKRIEENNKKVEWKDREPFAFWRGNARVSSARNALRRCNASDDNHWKAHIYSLLWDKDTRRGFNNHTKLENQCDHRYKIYAEGRSWSVSEKYILACDSMALFIKPNYYDFFTRSLVPLRHYWPISIQNLCQHITFAVEWGNANTDEAEAIGKEGSNFIKENLKMELVYDYMLHVLQEYARLLRFEATMPKGAWEVTSGTLMASLGQRKARKFLEDSKVKSARDKPPCKMPPPFEPQQLHVLMHTKESLIKQVEMEGNRRWNNQNNK